MIKRIGKLLLALALAGFFFWLAFRHVDLAYLWSSMKQISLWWLAPFSVVMILSNVIRAERWKLLIEHEKKDLDHMTLTAGVFNGYFFNLIGPRFGEVSRPVYVSRRENISTSKLFGTIVVERIFDMLTLIVLFIITVAALISNKSLLRQVFGDRAMDIFTGNISLFTAIWIVIAVIGLLILAFAAWKTVQCLAAYYEKVNDWLMKFKQVLINFKDGLLSVREVERWGLFVFYTALIWFCYILMSFIPFWMFNLQQVYGLGMLQAVIITVVSSVGMAMPSPAGLGTYEYLVKKAMVILFGVPAVTGLAYATITHAVTLLLVILLTPITFAIDKWRQARVQVDPV
jgi:uncharacterized protein (TIRG00374 family)